MAKITPSDVEIIRYQYDDLPLTLFPSDVDVSQGSFNGNNGTSTQSTNNHPYMKDINSKATKSLVTQFDDYYSKSNQNECQNMLDNDLYDYSFNSERYNWLSDAIIALQRFSKDGVKKDRETTLTFLHRAINDKLGQNFNLDYHVSFKFIFEQTKILKEG